MTTALSIITRAMQKIGALTKNETPSSDESSDALETLNDLLASWSNDSMKIYSRALENFTLTANDGEYTIGSGANFNTTRPLQIISAYVRSGTIDYPLDIVTEEDFARISFKSQTGPPEFLNYNNGFSSGTIKLYPLPDAADTLFLLSEKELSSISTIGTTVNLPPGWKRALIYNLALDLSPEYGRLGDAEMIEIKEIAGESKSSIMRAVMRNRTMDAPKIPGASGNIYTGWL